MALVGRITSSVAHSIRNPLTVIGGFARSILKTTAPNDAKRAFIESIAKETYQLEGVLDEVLTYADSLYPTKDMWDVNQLVETAQREIQDRLIRQDFTVHFHPGQDLPPVWVDYKQTAYCIRTILLEDIDGQEHGEITISVEQQGSEICLRIEDKGRKLNEDELEAMLTPFSETCQMGSGLSLALCRSMLDKLNIPFLVVAPPEGGVVYTIKLPTRKEE